MSDNAAGLPYYGGKSERGQINGWINDLLGPNRGLYVEPFAGMLGIMLSRPKSTNEIINDANSWVYNWWFWIREQPREFGRLLDCTPRSREQFEICARRQQKMIADNTAASTLEDAWTFFVVCNHSIHSGSRASPGQFGVHYDRKHGYNLWDNQDVMRLHARVRDCQIENRCAVKILEKTAPHDYTLIYCDPPYLTATTTPYGKWTLDKEEFTSVCAEQKGRVAISGYNDEWDSLLESDWRRYEKEVTTSMTNHTTSDIPNRTEVLWTNYEWQPVNAGMLL